MNGLQHLDVAEDFDIWISPSAPFKRQFSQSSYASSCLDGPDAVQSIPLDDELCALDFSWSIAEPGQVKCPLVACSTGFTALLGYDMEEIIGSDQGLLMLQGVPVNLIDEKSQLDRQKFCESAQQGEAFTKFEEWPASLGIEKPWIPTPLGECICAQKVARKSGEVIMIMERLKHVELNETILVLALQTELQSCSSISEKKIQEALDSLDEDMKVIEHLLAQKFYYSASMRRQAP